MDNSPVKPKNSLSNARSISSEKRCIKFQALLNDVPPLNVKAFAQSIEKITDKVCVTHQSFSVADEDGNPTFLLVSANNLFFSFIWQLKPFLQMFKFIH